MTTEIAMRPFHVNSTDHNQLVAEKCQTTENIMKKVELFFSKPEHMGKLLPFLHGTSKISLRMVEWFVFTYAMQHTIDWFIGDEYFNVYLDYQAEMVDNRKQRFDPMGRKWRKEKSKNSETVHVYHGINFYYTDTDYVVTSVGQLNFFRWFIGKGVYNYMLQHFDELILQMNKYNLEQKQAKRIKSTTSAATTSKPQSEQQSETFDKNDKNKGVRVQAMKKVTKRNVEVYVSFD